ncbi:MAG: UDP-N-acetylmuramoyl-L-alanine--D-glutamate ligase [Aquificae bacterium]|nr:UDP-N-acetylmuramoyl-L-alanine--D-glutamate ligase [Aquificota bacterium]
MFLIYGKGKTGQQVAQFLQRRGEEFILRDDTDFTPSDLDKVNTVIVSPGIPFYHQIYKLAKKRRIPVVGEVEFAYNLFKGDIIGITGTDGKSTTTNILGTLLEEKKPFIGGNFGEPFINAVDKDYSLAVLELSSFQLYPIERFKPNIAVFLNIHTDHLDWHKRYSHYLLSKCKIFKNLTPQDKAVLNYQQKGINWNKIKGEKYFFSLERLPSNIEGAYWNGKGITVQIGGRTEFIDTSQYRLKGIHNIQNLMASVVAGILYGLTADQIQGKIPEIKGMPFRLQYVNSLNGVDFYNDAKATTPNAVETAVNSFKNRGVILIVGGIYKGGDFSFLDRYKNIKKVILFGRDRDKIKKFIKSTDYSVGETLEDCIKEAYKVAEKGDVILFSPGCASFDMFKNYIDRGNRFNKLVESLVNAKK